MELKGARSSRTPSTIRQGDRRKPQSRPFGRKVFNLQESVDSVFRQMVPPGEEQSKIVDVPYKFWDFHNSEMTLHFLQAAMNYFDAYTKLLHLNSPKDGQNEESENSHVEIAAATKEKQDCLKKLSQHYSRIILHCSNFERSAEDEKFFECFYYFTCAVLKLGIDPPYWPDMDRELGFIFRGDMFNINAHHTSLEEVLAVSATPLPQENPWLKQKTKKARGLLVTKHQGEMLKRANGNIERAENLRKAMQKKYWRLRQIATKKNRVQRNKKNKVAAMPLAPGTLSQGPVGSSVHAALSARSPIVSLLLPTSSEQAQATLKHAQTLQQTGPRLRDDFDYGYPREQVQLQRTKYGGQYS